MVELKQQSEQRLEGIDERLYDLNEEIANITDSQPNRQVTYLFYFHTKYKKKINLAFKSYFHKTTWILILYQIMLHCYHQYAYDAPKQWFLIINFMLSHRLHWSLFATV